MVTEKKRTALYIRCSTDRQETDMQRMDLTRYADQRGWEISSVYEDRGVSGARTSRPALNDLMKDVRRGKIDVVLVWKFDRFGRSLSHLVSSLNEFRERGVDFCSYTEAIDTSTSTGNLVFQIMGCIAEFERSLIAERVRAGMQAAKAKGRKIGRPSVDLDREALKRMKEEGRSIRQIAAALGVGRSTVQARLAAVSSGDRKGCWESSLQAL